MKAEVLCVGTELILGDTINTNAAYICRKLAKLGINCFFHTAVGDNPQRIAHSIDLAIKRADLLIVTGGLGPTDDDITMQAIAEFFKAELVFNEQAYEKIKNFFASRNREVPQKARKQAFFPEGSEVITNPTGTAPGIAWDVQGKHIIVLPGVPDELYIMWETFVENYLGKFSEYFIEKKFLKFFGIPEGSLGEKIKDLMACENPTVAPLVSEGQTNIRIAAKAKTKHEAGILIDKMQNEILSRAGEYLWGYDEDTLEKVVGSLLVSKGLTVSAAESCTGGLISSRLTDTPGSSGYIKMNIVAYSNEAKINTLGINAGLIKTYGAVSKQVAAQMAQNVRELAGTDIGLGITGIAGPTGATPQKPVGLVYIGLSDRSRTEVHKVNINPGFGRKTVKHRASSYALNYLRLFIK